MRRRCRRIRSSIGSRRMPSSIWRSIPKRGTQIRMCGSGQLAPVAASQSGFRSPRNRIFIFRALGGCAKGCCGQKCSIVLRILELYFVDAHSGRSRKVLTERTPDAWINLLDDFRVTDGRLILKSGDRFVWPSWRDGHTQLYLYSFDSRNPLAADAKLERQLTQGDFEVLGIDGIDEAAGVVYFTCNKDDPRQRQLYSAKLDGSGLKRISREDGTHESTFSDDGKQYVDNFSAMLTPPRLSACSVGVCRSFWDSRNVNDFGLIAPKALEFQAEDGTKLYGQLLLPRESTANGRIPLIVYIYGGPAAQVVRDEWAGTHDEGLFHQILAQHGFAVFSVDNRGTPGRDRKFQTAIRHQFGGIELNDQLTALNQLLA